MDERLDRTQAAQAEQAASGPPAAPAAQAAPVPQAPQHPGVGGSGASWFAGAGAQDADLLGQGRLPAPGQRAGGAEAMAPTADLAAEGSAPEGLAGAGFAAEGFAMNGLAADGLAAEGLAVDGVGGGGQGEEAPDETDLDLLEPAWQGPRRLNRVTALLLAGILAAGGFFGGVLVQKSHDRGLSSGSASLAGLAQRFRAAGGLTGAGLGGGLGTGNGSGSASGGTAGVGAAAGGSSADTGAGQAAQGIPVVVGTVVSVSGNSLTVKNFAGTQVLVHVPAGTPVTALGLSGLRPGATVSVTGSKAGDGSVTATSVVSRAPAG